MSLHLLQRIRVDKLAQIYSKRFLQGRSLSMTSWESPHLAQGSPKPTVDDDKIVVYNMRFCPFAERTVLVMLAKNIPFELINIDLKKKPDWFVESTLGKVPVMLYKGKIVPESLITCDYFDEVYPEPRLHPVDPLQKALDRVVVEKQTGVMRHLYPIFAKLPPPRPAPTTEEKVELFKNVVNYVGSFEDELKVRGSTFLGGDKPCMADYMIWPIFERVECLPFLLPDISEKVTLPSNLMHIHSWMKGMRGTEAVSKYGFSPERLAKLTAIHNKTDSYDDALKESAGL